MLMNFMSIMIFMMGYIFMMNVGFYGVGVGVIVIFLMNGSSVRSIVVDVSIEL